MRESEVLEALKKGKKVMVRIGGRIYCGKVIAKYGNGRNYFVFDGTEIKGTERIRCLLNQNDFFFRRNNGGQKRTQKK